MAIERPVPFWPAWSEDEAHQRAERWKRGEYPPVSLQEILGFADAEFESWRTQNIYPARHRRTFAKKPARAPS